MTDLQKALERYIYDQENPITNYNLAFEYDKLGQGAAAISFYLRCSERTEDSVLAYTCQIKIAQIFDSQGNRDRTVETTLKKAIAFRPDRPEAYYIYSRFLEHRKDHVTAYMMANLGLNCDLNVPKNDLIEYRGEYGLIFQKAVSAWWVGKPTECRFLFRELAEKYLHELDTIHFESVKRNLYFLGSGPDSISFKEYKKENQHKLRHKFPGLENIECGYGQVMQDIFTLSVLNGKRNGTYLEIGSCYPFRGNNTFLLENQFGWNGVGIEYDEKYIADYRANRTNAVIHQDALTVDYDELLSKLAVDGVVDYLQLDCDPPDITYAIMERIPFDKYKFAVITYEHDHYLDMSKTYRDKSRSFLESKGYKLLVSNISPDDMTPFEDWWVHPDLIDSELLRTMEKNDGKITDVSKYFFFD